MPAGPEPMTAARLPLAGWTLERHGRLHARGLRLEHLVAGVAMAVADRDGLFHLVPAAVLLARGRADAAEHAGERDGALEDARRLDERVPSVFAFRKPGMSMWLGHLFWHGGRQYALWSLKISSRLVLRTWRNRGGLGLDDHARLARRGSS